LDALLNEKNSYNVSSNESNTFSLNMVDSSPKCSGRVLNIVISCWFAFKKSFRRNESVINMSDEAAYSFMIRVAVAIVEIFILFFKNSSSPSRMCKIEYGTETPYNAFC
jgi:hypothetical protein